MWKNHSNLSDECVAQFVEAEKYELIGRLVSGLAHNMQSPLTAIKGYAQLMKLDHPEMDQLNLILEETAHLQKLAYNLLLKSRWLQDRRIRPINLNMIIETEIDFLQAHLQFKHKVIKEISLHPELPMLEGVHADFSQIVLNVLLNGIDAVYGSDQELIRIKTDYEASRVFFIVEDTGAGFDPEMRHRLFDWFYSTKPMCPDPDDDKHPVGSGRGLCATQVLVGRYDGIIQLSGADSGSGACCVVSFPIRKRE